MAKKRTGKRLHLISRVKTLIRVPFVNQGTDHTCGVAATLSVLYFWDKTEIYEDDLAKILHTNEKTGTVTDQIMRYADSQSFSVIRNENMTLEGLKQHIRDGKPVIVLLQAWPTTYETPWPRKFKDGHFAVAIGYSSKNIYFMDPSTVGNYTFIPNSEFLKRWHDIDGSKSVKKFGLIIWKKRPAYDDRVAVKLD